MRQHVTVLKYGIVLLLWVGSVTCDLYAQEDPARAKGLAREYYQEGVFYGKQEKYIEAISALEKAIEMYPAYADAYNALGVIYHQQKQYQQAVEQYLSAIETEPNHVKARTNLAMVYNEQRQYQKAKLQLDKALQIQPGYAPAKKLLESVRQHVEGEEAKERERQERERQERERQEALAKESLPSVKPPPQKKPPKSAVAFFASGTTLFTEGNLEASIQAYREGLDLQPASADGYSLLAMAYREKFRVTTDMQWREQEIAALTTALKYDSQHVPALIAVGELYYEQGDHFTARTFFENALTYQPDHPAKEQLEAILHPIQFME